MLSHGFFVACFLDRVQLRYIFGCAAGTDQVGRTQRRRCNIFVPTKNGKQKGLGGHFCSLIRENQKSIAKQNLP